MPQETKWKTEKQNQDTSRPRNESAPGQNATPTNSNEKLDEKNSPDVRDALNESQL